MIKTLNGYDGTNIGVPDSFGRKQLRALEFLELGGERIFYSDVDTRKTYLACELVAQAC